MKEQHQKLGQQAKVDGILNNIVPAGGEINLTSQNRKALGTISSDDLRTGVERLATDRINGNPGINKTIYTQALKTPKKPEGQK